LKLESMRRLFRAAAPILLGFVLCAHLAYGDPASPASPSTFQVGGAVSSPGAWTFARIQKDLAADVQPISYTLKGTAHTADAVPLIKLIQASQPVFNPHIKHHDLQFVVVVQGSDGYTVDFSLAELLPDFGNKPVWIGLDEDGKPLSAESGPVQLIVPDYVKPARWVHSVATITVVDTSKLP
jgi:DMSO/TMAO reductase YedYZ molybdopterin-dependent catalytic subunit